MASRPYTPDKQRLLNLFETLDTKKDGFISFDELQAYLAKNGQSIEKRDIKGFIKQGDARSNDGMLDEQEFMDLMIHREKELWSQFVALDRDGSGHVSSSELFYYIGYHRLDIELEQARELFNRMDRDSNLKISWDEFREFNQFRFRYDLSSETYFGDSYNDGLIAIPEKKSRSSASESIGIVEKLICGGLAGVISRTLTAPLDRVKVLLQVQGQQKLQGANSELGVKGVFDLIKKDGFMAFFRGNGISCLKVFPENALRFMIFEQLCSSDLFSAPNSIAAKLLSGGLTGITVQTIMYPFEITKTRIMTQKSLSLPAILKDIYVGDGTKSGVRNFYKGITPALMGIIPFSALQLGLSKAGTDACNHHYHGNPGVVPLIGISSSATLFAMGCTYPLQLTKCQMQAYKGPEAERPRFGPLVKKILQKDGIRGLYRGFAVNASKAIPASAIGWVSFHKLRALYKTYNTSSSQVYSL